MGMYTELHYNAEIKPDAPESVVNILRFMLGETETQPELPQHPLFQTDRWRWMLTSDSCYFDANSHSTLRYDDISKSHYLCVRCNLKNYCNEIQQFCDWVRPYINKEPGDFLGFSRYEETETPTLIYA